jgi:hypothetical protein
MASGRASQRSVNSLPPFIFSAFRASMMVTTTTSPATWNASGPARFHKPLAHKDKRRAP